MVNEEFGVRGYVKELPVYEARIMFKHRCMMTEHVKMNFKNNSEYSKKLWKCDECLKMDSESHLLICESYAHLREYKNLEDDRDLCQYLHTILQLRTKQALENRN